MSRIFLQSLLTCKSLLLLGYFLGSLHACGIKCFRRSSTRRRRSIVKEMDGLAIFTGIATEMAKSKPGCSSRRSWSRKLAAKARKAARANTYCHRSMRKLMPRSAEGGGVLVVPLRVRVWQNWLFSFHLPPVSIWWAAHERAVCPH